MKKFRKYLPLLILILALVILLHPFQNKDAETIPTVSPMQQFTESSPDAGAEPSGGDLQLLEPSAAQETGNTDPAEQQQEPDESEAGQTPEEAPLPEDGSFTTKEDVSLYLITYGHLPDNFVTKAEAEKAGWNGGSLEQVMPGKCIGGNRFGNREGQLPKAKGRIWWECDINTLGRRSRGAERLVYSNDGLIYYTADHYDSFTLLYGDP